RSIPTQLAEPTRESLIQRGALTDAARPMVGAAPEGTRRCWPECRGCSVEDPAGIRALPDAERRHDERGMVPAGNVSGGRNPATAAPCFQCSAPRFPARVSVMLWGGLETCAPTDSRHAWRSAIVTQDAILPHSHCVASEVCT